jgi:chromosome segregation ATPase
MAGEEAPIRRAYTENNTLTFNVLNPDELQERFHHFGIDIKKIDQLPVEMAALLDSHLLRLEEQTVKRLSDISSEISLTNERVSMVNKSLVKCESAVGEVNEFLTKREPVISRAGDTLAELLGHIEDIQSRLDRIEARLAEFE